MLFKRCRRSHATFGKPRGDYAEQPAEYLKKTLGMDGADGRLGVERFLNFLGRQLGPDKVSTSSQIRVKSIVFVHI